MTLLELVNRLRDRFRRDTLSAELDEELRFHQSLLERDQRSPTGSAADTRRLGRLRLGNPTHLRERARDAWSLGWVDDLIQDGRYAVRFLRRSPGFTAVAVLSLAIGIGANTAVFSLVDRIFLRTIEVPDARGLYALGMQKPGAQPEAAGSFSLAEFRQLRPHVDHLFSGVFAAVPARRLSLLDGGQPEDIPRGALLVSGEFFSALGVRPAVGRPLGPDDDRAAGAHAVVVLGNRYWRTRFGGDAAVLGRTLLINDYPFVVVGVMPQGFTGPTVGQDPALYLPLLMESAATRGTGTLDNPGTRTLQVMGRLRPDIDASRADGEVTALYRRIAAAAQPGMEEKEKSLVLGTKVSLRSAAAGFGGVRDSYRTLLSILSAMVLAMLLIACANVGSLLVARSAARQREVAVRLSLGAGRGRLVRQLLTECMLLALAGGAVGLMLARVAGPAIASLITGSQTIWLETSPDARVLAFTTAASMLSAAFFGLLPALGSTRLDLTSALRGAPSSHRGMRISVGKALVTVQVALSVLLVAGAALFSRSLQRMYAVELGFERDNLLVIRTNPTRNGYQGERARALLADLRTRVGALPEVRSITLANNTPFEGTEVSSEMTVDGYGGGSGPPPSAHYLWIGPEYFATMRQRLLMGRDLSSGDDFNAPKVALVNETFVTKYLPGRTALGTRVARGVGSDKGPSFEIVGIVVDARENDLRGAPAPMVYLPMLQNPRPGRASLVIRTIGDPARFAVAARATIRARDPRLDVLDVMTMTAQLDDTVGRERVIARLSAFFGMVALALACVGLYGVMAYAVARRTTEIGIRMALGAESGVVARGVVRETMGLVLFGLALGVPAAIAAARQARSLLFELGPADPVTLAVTVALLMAVALVAGGLPALRASRVNPLIALRHD